MYKNRKTPNVSQRSILKKSNALKMRQTTVTDKKCSTKQVQKTDNAQALRTMFDGASQNGFHLHYASTSQTIYSTFKNHCYLPPHLTSSLVDKVLFKSEKPDWKVRPSSAKKYDYDKLYQTSENRYDSIRPSRKWSTVKSKIKYLLDQDRSTYQHFAKPANRRQVRRQSHPDDDLSEQSSIDHNCL